MGQNKFLVNLKSELESKIDYEDYDFLLTNEFLGDNIVYLCLSGSYAYGTNVETSDVDIRGISVNTADEILLGKDHEEVVDVKTDTTIYTVNKLFKLLANCNPNTIELLGVRDEDVIYQNEIGKLIRDNVNLFLSKKCIESFAGYANAQLRRLDNKTARLLDEVQHNEHIINSMINASVNFEDRYGVLKSDFNIKQIDKTICIEFDKKPYDLENLNSMLNELHNVKKDYDKLGKRNTSAIEHSKLGKHSMHLIRLFLMCIDILKYGEINTYRENEHKLLMEIRNEKYLGENMQPTREFMEMVDMYKKKMDELAITTKLPEKPDMDSIKNLQKKINRLVIERNGK